MEQASRVRDTPIIQGNYGRRELAGRSDTPNNLGELGHVRAGWQGSEVPQQFRRAGARGNRLTEARTTPQ